MTRWSPFCLNAFGEEGALTTRVTMQDLRQVAASLRELRGQRIEEASLRTDFRHLRLEMEPGLQLLVTAERDETGQPCLAVDVVRTPPVVGVQLDVGLGVPS